MSVSLWACYSKCHGCQVLTLLHKKAWCTETKQVLKINHDNMAIFVLVQLLAHTHWSLCLPTASLYGRQKENFDAISWFGISTVEKGIAVYIFPDFGVWMKWPSNSVRCHCFFTTVSSSFQRHTVDEVKDKYMTISTFAPCRNSEEEH